MPIFTAATPGSLTAISFLSHLSTSADASSSSSSTSCYPAHASSILKPFNVHSRIPGHKSRHPVLTARVSLSGTPKAENSNDSATSSSAASSAATAGVLEDSTDEDTTDAMWAARRSADWKAAKAYHDKGYIYKGRVEGFNGGGLRIRFYSLLGFLPFSEMSPSHCCKEPQKAIYEVAKGLLGSLLPVKVIKVDEETKKLIFSEREASWSKYSERVNVGDIFPGMVGYVEDYGAFVHLRFPDGLYHLTGLVHVSEASWDIVKDVRDILNVGDEVRVKVVHIDRGKMRMSLSLKQLEEDPLLETLEKVIPQDGSVGDDILSAGTTIDPLPGLEAIFQELLREDGIDDLRISRQGFEKRVVSQDLQLWLSNAPPTNKKFTLLARAGRQVQEIQLTTTLDQEGIKKALQRALERVP